MNRKVDKRLRLLFLAANPIGSTPLRLDAEARDIQERLSATPEGNRFDFHHHGAVRPADLQKLLLSEAPDLVHFSGHGTSLGRLVFEDAYGEGQEIPCEAIGSLFQILQGQTRGVVLNACYSEAQAVEIAKHVDFVIGMSDSLEDDSAIAFATSFYQALAYGQTIEVAFNLGCNQIHLEDLEDHNIPVLTVRPGLNAAELGVFLPQVRIGGTPSAGKPELSPSAMELHEIAHRLSTKWFRLWKLDRNDITFATKEVANVRTELEHYLASNKSILDKLVVHQVEKVVGLIDDMLSTKYVADTFWDLGKGVYSKLQTIARLLDD